MFPAWPCSAPQWQAPIPRGIRFAPIDAELFEYLDQKLRGMVEDVGLDRFLVQRLRGVADGDGLIPEVELLKFPRPWHLPGEPNPHLLPCPVRGHSKACGTH